MSEWMYITLAQVVDTTNDIALVVHDDGPLIAEINTNWAVTPDPYEVCDVA